MKAPDELFRFHTKQFQIGVPAGYVTSVPAITLAGWIPYFSDLEGLEAAGAHTYSNHKFARRSHFFDGGPGALMVLFQSGNILIENSPDNPNQVPTTKEDYERLVSSKNFRFALSIQDIEMGTADDGSAVYVSYSWNALPGYTPIRVPMLPISWQWFMDGIGKFKKKEERTSGGGCVLQFHLRFRLGSISDQGCYLLNGDYAPWAWVHATYSIGLGSANLEVRGSVVPSHCLGSPAGPDALYDMLSASTKEIDGFFNTGGFCDAPERSSGCLTSDFKVNTQVVMTSRVSYSARKE